MRGSRRREGSGRRFLACAPGRRVCSSGPSRPHPERLGGATDSRRHGPEIDVDATDPPLIARSAPAARPRTALTGVLALGCLLVAGACAGGERPEEERRPAARGTGLVVGSTLERYGLLVVPRDGGTAHLRSLADPADSLWGGRAELPAPDEVRPLGGAAVLLTAEGDVYRYRPAVDRLVELGRAEPGARWSAADGFGLFAGAGRAVLVGAEAAWTYEFPAEASWAAVVAGGRVLARPAAPEDSARTWLYERGSPEPVAGAGSAASVRLAASGDAPTLVTAWGTRLAAVGPAGDLVLLSLPQLERVAPIPLPSRPAVLAGSPSSHLIYGGTRDGRLLAVGRFDGSVRRIAELGSAVTALRPSLFGGALLAAAGGRVWYVSGAGGEPVGLEGEWREDLPLALPGDRVLLAGETGIRLWERGGPPEGRSLPDAPPDAWWVPVRWRPRPPPSLAVASGAGERTAGAASEGAAGADAGDTSAGVGAGDPRAEPEGEGVPGPGTDTASRAERPSAESGAGEEDRADPGAAESGFYAIVASSQAAGGIRRLTEDLAEVGFPVAVQRHRDEAGELWYRALVGPYDAREEAEEAAARLRRERGLEAWITEVGPDLRAGATTP